MIKNYKIIMSLFGLLTVFSTQVLAAGVGSDANPSSIGTNFMAFYSPTPTIITTRTPYGGTVCSLSSAINGFTSASAKWRTPNIAGTMSNGGYTYEIQKTNISGLGVIARLGANFVTSPSSPAIQVIGSNYVTITPTTSPGATTVYMGYKYWALVTIPGEPLIPGSYNIGQAETMIDVWCKAGNASNDTHGGGYLSGAIVIAAPTCYLGSDISSVMTLNLGAQQWVNVRNLSVGSNFGSVYKSLSMECQAGSWPKVTISDKNNSNNNSTIISLTNPSAPSTAKGVGVQIFLNNRSVAQSLGVPINLTPMKLTNKTVVELPLEFKYIKTSSTLSTGEANAIVDLTFTYD